MNRNEVYRQQVLAGDADDDAWSLYALALAAEEPLKPPSPKKSIAERGSLERVDKQTDLLVLREFLLSVMVASVAADDVKVKAFRTKYMKGRFNPVFKTQRLIARFQREPGFSAAWLKLIKHLHARHIRWDYGAVAGFVFSDAVPRYSALDVSEPPMRFATFDVERISLTMDPTMRPDVLYYKFKTIRPRTRKFPDDDKLMKLALFLWQRDDEWPKWVDDTRGSVRVNALREAWNAYVSSTGDERRTFDSVKAFTKACGNAFAWLMDPLNIRHLDVDAASKKVKYGPQPEMFFLFDDDSVLTLREARLIDPATLKLREDKGVVRLERGSTSPHHGSGPRTLAAHGGSLEEEERGRRGLRSPRQQRTRT